jgi:hypothetical protein
MIIDALILMIPIVVGGVLHMLAVSKGWFGGLAVPINAKAFGPNKTWRGVVLMPTLTLPGVLLLLWTSEQLAPELRLILSSVSPLVLGLGLGLGYILLELPNSFIKRQMGIPAGETPEKHAWFFLLFDQWDSAIGFALAYWLLTPLSVPLLALMILLFPLVALAVKRLLYWARWKEKKA